MSDVPPVPYGDGAHPLPGYTLRGVVAQRAVPTAQRAVPTAQRAVPTVTGCTAA